MYGGVNLPRHAKPKREVSKEGCVKGMQGRRDAGYARNIVDVSFHIEKFLFVSRNRGSAQFLKG